MRKIPIVVTAYCDGEGSEIKIRMAEKLCQELNTLNIAPKYTKTLQRIYLRF